MSIARNDCEFPTDWTTILNLSLKINTTRTCIALNPGVIMEKNSKTGHKLQ